MIYKDNMCGVCSLWEPVNREELVEVTYDMDIRGIRISGISSEGSLNEASWKMLNDIVFSKRNDIFLVVSGFYSIKCDLRFMSIMTNVEKFTIGSINDPVGFDNICNMKKLKELSIVIPVLDNYEFLKNLSLDIEDLTISTTGSKKLDLSFLENLKKLRKLEIEDIFKGIEVLSQLDNIEELTLNRVSTPDISYLSHMKKLWSLRVILGGIKDFSALEGMSNLKYLELYQIRNLNNISFISKLYGLQFLRLEGLTKVNELPSFIELKKIRRVLFTNLKMVNDYSNLVDAEALEDVYLSGLNHLEAEDLNILKQIPNLKDAFAGFGSNKKKKAFNTMMSEHNVSISQKYEEFVFYI